MGTHGWETRQERKRKEYSSAAEWESINEYRFHAFSTVYSRVVATHPYSRLHPSLFFSSFSRKSQPERTFSGTIDRSLLQYRGPKSGEIVMREGEGPRCESGWCCSVLVCASPRQTRFCIKMYVRTMLYTISRTRNGYERRSQREAVALLRKMAGFVVVVIFALWILGNSVACANRNYDKITTDRCRFKIKIASRVFNGVYVVYIYNNTCECA